MLLKTVSALAFIFALVGCGAEAPPPDDQITMARPPWSSGHFQAEVYRQVLQGDGYQVSDPAENTITPDLFYPAAAGGAVDLWTAGWQPLHDVIMDTEVDGEPLADSLTVLGHPVEALQVVYSNVEDADSVEDPRFDVNGDGVADVFGCDLGWGCQREIDSLIAENGWELNHLSSNYDALISEVVKRVADGKPTLWHQWTPHYASLLLDGKDMDFGMSTNEIRVVANREWLEERPQLAAVLESVRIPVADIEAQNLLMFEGEDTEADIARHAREWIEANR